MKKILKKPKEADEWEWRMYEDYSERVGRNDLSQAKIEKLERLEDTLLKLQKEEDEKKSTREAFSLIDEIKNTWYLWIIFVILPLIGGIARADWLLLSITAISAVFLLWDRIKTFFGIPDLTEEKVGKLWDYIIGSVVFGVITYVILTSFIGKEEINVFFEKRGNYKTQYYLNIFPDSANSKNYNIKADIQKLDGNYWLDKIYWPNGGHTIFEDCLILQGGSGGDEDYPHSCKDDEERKWKIEIDKKY